MKCNFCQAEINGTPNVYHVALTKTDNQNKREDIKFPVSWASELVAFCSASCLSEYIRHYSGHTTTETSAKVQGTPSQITIKTVLNEPFRQNTQTKQDLTKTGFKRLENDKNKGDLREEVGLKPLSPQDQSQQIIYKKLNNLKEKQNNNMETKARAILQCDNCRKSKASIYNGVMEIEIILPEKDSQIH
jgi:hypothetical protein